MADHWLEDIEQIRRLKYAYLRLLDTKRFDELGTLLTEDATSAFASGRLAHDGREAIVRFLTESLGTGAIITMHSAHHPEIEVTAEDRATGTWYLEDLVIAPAHDFVLHGTALYRDEYRKVDGRWMISHTGYERIFEERRKRSTGEVLALTSMFDDR
ncbi:MAG: nuclear transport factor 2 family protein [Acidimicrobiales bacterium]